MIAPSLSAGISRSRTVAQSRRNMESIRGGSLGTSGAAKGGELTGAPLRFAGSRRRLNIDTSAVVDAAVELRIAPRYARLYGLQFGETQS